MSSFRAPITSLIAATIVVGAAGSMLFAGTRVASLSSVAPIRPPSAQQAAPPAMTIAGYPVGENDPALPNIAVSGDVARLTPDPLAMLGATSCSDRGFVRDATVGTERLPIAMVVMPSTSADSADQPCVVHVKVGGVELPDGAMAFGRAGSSVYESARFAAEAYLIGSAPNALFLLDAGHGGGGDHDGDRYFQLYVARGSKMVEVFAGSSEGHPIFNVSGNVLTIDQVYHWRSGESLAAVVPETMSFSLDPERGRVHWHASTDREADTVKQWICNTDASCLAARKAAVDAQQQAAASQARQLAALGPTCRALYEGGDQANAVVQAVAAEEQRLIEARAVAGLSLVVHNSVNTAESDREFAWKLCGDPNITVNQIAYAMFGIDRSISSLGVGN